MRRPHGHTLVELVVVLAIVATLIALAMPRYLALVRVAQQIGAQYSLDAPLLAYGSPLQRLPTVGFRGRETW